MLASSAVTAGTSPDDADEGVLSAVTVGTGSDISPVSCQEPQRPAGRSGQQAPDVIGVEAAAERPAAVDDVGEQFCLPLLHRHALLLDAAAGHQADHHHLAC